MASQLGGQAPHDRAVGAPHRGPHDRGQQPVGERGAHPGVRERDVGPAGVQRFDGVGAVGQASAGHAGVALDDAPRRIVLDMLRDGTFYEPQPSAAVT